MNGDMVTGLVLALVYFVLLVVVAVEPQELREPVRRGRHRRDPAEGAR